MKPVEKFDHPDLVGGILWADCELAFIHKRDTQWSAKVAELTEANRVACEGWAEEQNKRVEYSQRIVELESQLRVAREALTDIVGYEHAYYTHPWDLREIASAALSKLDTSDAYRINNG